MIDMRSDTVTLPTDAMRQAMASANVGDDVYGEDPTVNALERKAAELLELEAALFVPSGTMGNQIAIHLVARPGDEVLTEAGSHIVLYELGAMAAISGAQVKAIEGVAGLPGLDAVREILLAPVEYDIARVRLVVLENSHNHAGGRVLPLESIAAIQAVAREQSLPLHLDGARMFNACHALGRSPAEMARGFDSVMFCLSKGLGAPVGSLLVGSREFIDEARIVRKRLGGGMRQAGILAAAGLWALEHHRDRLAEDHQRADEIARCLTDQEGMRLSGAVETNIVIVELEDHSQDLPLLEGLRQRGVLASSMGPGRVRFVTHLNIEDDDVVGASSAIREVWAAIRRR